MAVAEPYVLRDPYVAIVSGTSVEADLSCHLRSVSLTPTDSEADVETACNPGGVAPGTTTWTLELEVLQSFGPDASTNPGLFETLSAYAKSRKDFVVKPTDSTTSNTNPQAAFKAWVPSIPFYVARVGQSSPLTLTFRVEGDVAFTTS